MRLLALASLILLQSCNGIIYSQMTNKLSNDLTKSQVIDILGTEPFEKKSKNDNEVMVYYVHSSVFDLIFPKRFPYFGFYPFSLTGQEFWIVLKNGKVSTFGSANNFGNSLNNIGN